MSEKCKFCGDPLSGYDSAGFCSSHFQTATRHWSCYERELKQLRDWNMRFEERAIKAEAELAKWREVVQLSIDKIDLLEKDDTWSPSYYQGLNDTRCALTGNMEERGLTLTD